MHYLSTCTDEGRSTASTLRPLSLSRKKNYRSEVAVLLKQSSKDPFSENFLATGGFFERNTYRITVLGCLTKERR